jgi:hypothetical protein
MPRRLPVLVALLLASCTPDTGDADRLRAELREERDVAEQLAGDLGRARARIRSMEREARKPPPPDPARFVDLWYGGPTMGGTFLALPRLGVLRWRCNVRNHYFRILYLNGGATTHVEYDTPGAGKRSTLHSGGTLEATIRAGQTVTWTITHRHPPGFIRARISVTPEVSDHGSCVLDRVELQATGRAYD